MWLVLCLAFLGTASALAQGSFTCPGDFSTTPVNFSYTPGSSFTCTVPVTYNPLAAAPDEAGYLTLTSGPAAYVYSGYTVYTNISLSYSPTLGGAPTVTETGITGVIFSFPPGLVPSSLNPSGVGEFFIAGGPSANNNSFDLPFTLPMLTGLSLSPTTVQGTYPAQAAATINVNAPLGGTSLQVSGSDPSAVPVTSTVVVPAGSSRVTFSVRTAAVSTVTTSTIQATLNGFSAAANLTINPLGLQSLLVKPATVAGGQSSQGTVILTSAAPAGGTTVALASSNAAAMVPANITVPAGAASVSFPVTTTAVSGNTQCVISATLGAKTLTAPLAITGATALSLEVAPTSVAGGNAARGTVTLSSPAPTGGAAVTLSCNSQTAGVTVPTQVMVAAGAKTAPFTLTTQAVGAILVANISATEAGNSAAAPLVVTPPALTGLTLSPTSVVAGQYSTGMVTISSPAPSSGLSILISSDNAAATVAGTIIVPAGATSGTFPIATSPASSNATANISAAFGGLTKSASLSIAAASPVLTSVVVNPGNAVVQTGATQQFTATALDQNGVALSNQPTFIWSVGSGAGSISSSTGLFTAGSNAGGPFTVTATAGGVSGTASVTIETFGTGTTVLTPFTTVKNTKWTIAGYGGMRGIGTGSITISGVTGVVTRAYLYWHGPTNSTSPTANATVTFNGTSITGSNIGFAADNCWFFANSQAYRADVTSLVAGSGNYSLANFVKPGGIDINGVTLIVFYNDGTNTGNRDVMIFDGNESNVLPGVNGGQDSPSTWNDTFTNINYVTGTKANLCLGVSDGQIYYG